MELSIYILSEMENKLPDIRFPVKKKESKTLPDQYSCPKFAVISEETLPYLSMISSNEKINMKSFKIHKINRYKKAAELAQSKVNFYSKNVSTSEIQKQRVDVLKLKNEYRMEKNKKQRGLTVLKLNKAIELMKKQFEQKQNYFMKS